MKKTGDISLYSVNGVRILRLSYSDIFERKIIINGWKKFYKGKGFYYQIAPDLKTEKIIV